MKLEHSFSVPLPPDEAFLVLTDVARIAPCMPGASVQTVTGDEFTGTVKVKVGPITISYGGQARFLEKNAAERRVVIEANGKEARGGGTAQAIVTSILRSGEEGTVVDVVTDSPSPESRRSLVAASWSMLAIRLSASSRMRSQRSCERPEVRLGAAH